VCFDLELTSLEAINTLTFAKLANVQTVGIGLYLALGVIQAVSAGGVAGLERRSNAIQRAVSAAKLVSLYHATRDIRFELARLENSFHGFNRTLLSLSAMLFAISTIYFAYCTINQELFAGLDATVFIIIFYLILPFLIFIISTAVILLRCRTVATQITGVEDEVFHKSFHV
jgi:hypothetical protein